MMKKILLINDDSVNSYGLQSSKEAVEDLGEVFVVAPAEQQTGQGHSITYFKPLKVSKTTLNDGSEAFSVLGTPADSVGVGVFGLLKEKPNLVISGINIGANVGRRITTSGTLGGAFEAAVHGIPSLGISIDVKNEDSWFSKKAEGIDFSFAKTILKRIAKNVLEKGMPEDVDVLNINIPAKATDDEIVVTRLGKQIYSPKIDAESEGEVYIWKDGEYTDLEEKSGVDRYTTLIENKVTVTPLSLDLTAKTDIKEWLV